MTTTTLTALIAITGDDDYATDSMDSIEEDLESGLLDAFGFPDGLEIKIKIISRTVT